VLERKRQQLLVNASVPFVSSETAWSQPEDDPDFVEMDVDFTDEERSDSEVEATADGAVENDITHGDTPIHALGHWRDGAGGDLQRRGISHCN
jgi:hypothetical protein